MEFLGWLWSPWLLVIPVLAFLIFIHELGHFVTAKLFGIRVLEFGFGFPPRMIGFRYRGTVYSVNWLLPLGGFVRFVGEEDPTDPDSLARHSVLRRTVVLLAGSAMNLLLPVVVITILLMAPHDTVTGGDILITGVAPRSPAMEAGLRGGDMILAVDGQRVRDPREMIDIVGGKRGREIELSVRRGPRVTGLGFSPEYAVVEPVTVVPRSDAPEMTVVETVTDPYSQASLSEARRYDSRLQIGDTIRQSYIGVMIGLANLRVERTSEPIWRAVPASFATMWGLVAFTKDALADGLSRGENPGIAGPIGIAQATAEGVDAFGLGWVWQLMAVLSLSLGILNLLPIPALDGGRLVFVLLEWVRRGKRVSPEREGVVHMVGFAILIGFVFFISYFDISRVISGEKLIP